MSCAFLDLNKNKRKRCDFGAKFTLPVVAYAGEHKQHLVQVGGHGVSPSLGQLRVVIGTGRLVHPGGRRVAAQRTKVTFHRREFQLQLTDEWTELPHEELQSRCLLRAGAAAVTTATYSQLELGPQRGVEETLPPPWAHGRGPELVSVGQKREYVNDKLAGQSHGSDTPAQSHGEQKKLLSENRPDIKQMLQPFLKIGAAAATTSSASSSRWKQTVFQLCLQYYWTAPLPLNARGTKQSSEMLQKRL